MIDLGIEWVLRRDPENFDRRGHWALWFSCGCCVKLDDDGSKMMLFQKRYVPPAKLMEPSCAHELNWMLNPVSASRIQEVLAYMRWLDEGGCPTHSPACVH